MIDKQGEGYGREALPLLKRWWFKESSTHRIYLDVKKYNECARKLYESEGFKVEGIARERRKEGENYISLIFMSI